MTSAMKLLLERGYGRVSLEAVAADAGVSKATIYHYFSNKDDLLTQSLSQRMAEKHGELEQHVATAGGSASDRLGTFLREFWKRSVTPQAGFWQQMLATEIVTDAPDVFAAWVRGLVERWRTVERIIREGQRDGEFGGDVDAEIAARTILSALSHQALFHVHFGLKRYAPYDSARLCSAMIEQFLRGLRRHS
jgi:AcrR family transcriptional regulator